FNKLAARLARLNAWTVIPATLAVATIVVSCEHPVTDPGSSIAQLVVSPQNVTLQQNQAEDFLAVGFTATGDSAEIAVSWSATGGSIDSSSAGKRHYGHYTSATCGTFTVTATSHPGNVSMAASVTVTGSPLPVASVSGGGLVTGVAAGSATITATSEGQGGTATITVSTVLVASVTVSPATASVQAGQTVQLAATPKDANGNPLSGRTVTWASSNSAVATVGGSGLVTGVTAGSATITATSEGKSGTSAITVTAPAPAPVASVTVTPAPSSVPTGPTVQLTATLKDAN